MVYGVTIIRFLGIILCFVNKDIELILTILVLIDCVANATFNINSYFDELVDDSHYYTSCFVGELLLLRDNALVLSKIVVFSFDDL